MKHSSATLLGIHLLLVACTDVADDRAARDETVGHYHDGVLRIDVNGGLAVIREATHGRITFWSNAPTWTATLARDASSPLTLEVRNVISGSTLEVTDPAGAVLGVRIADAPLRTRSTFVVDAPLGQMRISLMPPNARRPPPYQFALLGDIQGAIDQIQDVYQRIAAEPDLDFVLSPGDLTEQGSRDQLQLFERELQTLPIPLYSTLGNHELGTTPPPYQDLFGRANSHFHYRDTAFSLIDSASATIAPRSLDWLDGWLAEDQSRVHVFVTHYPPIDPIGIRNGSFASRAEAHQLIARLAEGKVDVSLHGHVHSFYAFTMAGIPAYISGGGGAIPERFDGIGRHFLVVQVEVDDAGTGRIDGVRVVRVD